MKFGKEFEAQMVPEWKEAYVDYNFLKTLLKDLQLLKQRNQPPAALPAGLKRRPTLYRAFSGLVDRHINHNYDNNHPTRSSSTTTSTTAGVDIESQTIMVNPVTRNGTRAYETTFLMVAEEGGEHEMLYFRRLDDEFNKVDKFHRSKVVEVMKEAEVLNKQMEALIAFRIKVDNPDPQGFWFDESKSVEITRLASDVAASTAALAASTPRGSRASSKFQ